MESRGGEAWRRVARGLQRVLTIASSRVNPVKFTGEERGLVPGECSPVKIAPEGGEVHR